MEIYRVAELPGAPLAAAATFHGRELPAIIAAMTESRDALTLVFAPADHTHRSWRLAAVQSLARARAPRRVNAVASVDEAAIDEAARYLDAADGVTGQYLVLDSHGAGEVLSSAP
jgi:hypothetical protein